MHQPCGYFELQQHNLKAAHIGKQITLWQTPWRSYRTLRVVPDYKTETGLQINANVVAFIANKQQFANMSLKLVVLPLSGRKIK